jgi:molybdenum cofactor cytidylyltransferase
LDTVVLAAGTASRFGDNKLLHSYGNRRIIEAVIYAALAVSTRVILVVGHDAERLLAVVRPIPNVDPVHNPWYARGMFTSIQCGVREVTSHRFAVVPGDLPGVAPSDFESVLSAGDHPVARPFHDGVPGHPVVMQRRLVPRILSLPSDSSMAEVHAYYGVHRVVTGNPAVHADIDTPFDLSRARV